MNIKESMPRIDPNRIAEPELVGRLTRQYGEPWQTDNKGIIQSLNYQWWANLYVAENHIIRVDEQFFTYDELDHVYVPQKVDHMVERLLFRILCTARDLEAPELKTLRYKKFETFGTHIRGIHDQPDAFKLPTPTLALRNGVIEFHNDKPHFRDFSPDVRIRQKASFTYDPNADCPRFKKLLSEIFDDPDDPSLLIRHMGLVIAGVNPVHAVGIIDGPANAGKTTIINLLILILGCQRTIQLRTAHLESQFELHAFHGKSLLYGVDAPGNFLNTPAAHVIKAL